LELLNSRNLLIASLLGFSALFAGSNLLVKAQSEPKLGCQATVDKVIQEIRAKGVKTVNFRVLKNSANQGVSSKRNDELEIILSESDAGNIILSETRKGNSQINAKITEILSSDTFLDSWSDEIFKSCDKTGTVYFYGLMTNEILRLVRTYK